MRTAEDQAFERQMTGKMCSSLVEKMHVLPKMYSAHHFAEKMLFQKTQRKLANRNLQERFLYENTTVLNYKKVYAFV